MNYAEAQLYKVGRNIAETRVTFVYCVYRKEIALNYVIVVFMCMFIIAFFIEVSQQKQRISYKLIFSNCENNFREKNSRCIKSADRTCNLSWKL